MRYITKILLLSGVSFFNYVHAADIAIIVHPSSNISQISEEDTRRIFLGKSRALPNGSAALPVDQADGAQDRIQFYSNFIGKTESQLKSYWATQIFSGKGTPPKVVGDATDVRTVVSKNQNAIGYIDKRLVDASVKAIVVTH